MAWRGRVIIPVRKMFNFGFQLRLSLISTLFLGSEHNLTTKFSIQYSPALLPILKISPETDLMNELEEFFSMKWKKNKGISEETWLATRRNHPNSGEETDQLSTKPIKFDWLQREYNRPLFIAQRWPCSMQRQSAHF